jgi:hypothetical protein
MRVASRSSQRALGALMLASAVLLGASVACAADTARVERSRVMTMTRGVKIFHGLEYDLVDALRAGQTDKLDQLLAEEFEQRSGAAPSTPMPREEWLTGSSAKAPGALLISDLVVHERGELSLASFKQVLRGPNLTPFVVDVWRRRADGSFELVTRYVSDLGRAAAKPPAKGRVPAARAPDGKG